MREKMMIIFYIGQIAPSLKTKKLSSFRSIFWQVLVPKETSAYSALANKGKKIQPRLSRNTQEHFGTSAIFSDVIKNQRQSNWLVKPKNQQAESTWDDQSVAKIRQASANWTGPKCPVKPLYSKRVRESCSLFDINIIGWCSLGKERQRLMCV